MPTKTKPKTRQQQQPATAIKISDSHREEIGDCLGLGDREDEQLKFERFRIKLERRLAKYAAELRGLSGVPLPAHIVAELEPIEKAATKLAELIHRDRLTEKATRALNSPLEDPYGIPSIGRLSVVAKLRSDLQTLLKNTATAVTGFKARSRSRQDRTVKSDYLRDVETTLLREFDGVAKEANKDDREAFLRIVRHYLKAAPVPSVASQDDPSQRIGASIAIGPTYTFDPKRPPPPPMEDAKSQHNKLGEEYALDKPADQDR